MNDSTECKANRLELLRSTARYLALGGLSLVSAGLIVRGGGSSAAACGRRCGCRGCPALAHCQLACAAARREAQRLAPGRPPAR